jgi:hypothetical protein
MATFLIRLPKFENDFVYCTLEQFQFAFAEGQCSVLLVGSDQATSQCRLWLASLPK